MRKVPQANKAILSLSPYIQGKSKIAGTQDPIKLSSNESSFGPSPEAIAAYSAVSSQLHRYPDGSQQKLKAAIAGVYRLNADNIICGNGSDEILDLLCRCYLAEGDEVILSSNHFAMSALYARIQGANIVYAREENYLTSVDDLIAKVSPKTRMVTLANPNNPTGSYLKIDEIRRIHAALPGDVLFVIDGAYAEYVDNEELENVSAMVTEFDNLVLTRTFSKIYGLSALRLGWAYCPAAIIDILQRVRSPFNTNSAAMAAASAAVKDTAYIEEVRKHTVVWLRRLEKEIGALGIAVVPSSANFYMLDFTGSEGKSAAQAAACLEERGIIPRQLKTHKGKEVLRITVGLDHENEAVISALKDYMQQ